MEPIRFQAPARTGLASFALVALLLSGCQSTSQLTRRNAMNDTTALLVLDLQEDFCHPEGRLHGLVRDELSRLDIVDRNVRLIRSAHRAGMPVIVSPIVFDYGQDQPTEAEGIAGAVIKHRAFDRNGPGSRLTPAIAELTHQAGIDVMPKPALSAFAGTDLAERLESLGVREVAISGLLTNYCVESTARDAFDRGFRVRIIGDATATFDRSQHAHTIDTIVPMLGKALTVAEFERSVAGTQAHGQ